MTTTSPVHEQPSVPSRTLPVAVVGATGGVGEGIVEALLAEGRRVIAVGRSAPKLEALQAYIAQSDAGSSDRLAVHVADVGTSGAAPAQQLRARFGPLGGAVISIGSFDGAGRRVLDLDEASWNEAIHNNLTSQFHAIRAMLPALHPQAALVHISGQSADFPYPGSALIGATNAARKSLVLALAAEERGRGPRIYELIIGVTRTRPRRAAGRDDERWIAAPEIGRRAGALLDGTARESDQPLHYALTPEQPDDPSDAGFRISARADVGHVALRVTDLERSLRFYRDALGFQVKTRMGDQAAFLSTGDYHHHLALLATPGDPGLEHIAIRLPDAGALAALVGHAVASGVTVAGPFDHGATESYYLSDPDGDGVEFYIDR